MADITTSEAEAIMRMLETRKTLGISSIERAIEEEVKSYRDRLTKEVIAKMKTKHEPVGSVPCPCGGIAKFKDNKKKRFF